MAGESKTAVDKDAEIERLRAALEHVANGNLSPCIIFAQRILDGASVKEAHAANVEAWRHG